MSMEYAIKLIRPDAAGIEFFITRYKPFRLQALQTDPSFFGSNYAREASMPEDFWRDRVTNISAKIYVAVHPESDEVLSSATLIRIIPVPPNLKARLGIEIGQAENEPLLHWAVNAVYTTPASRRKGIGREVMAFALKDAVNIAISEGKSCLFTVLVKRDNIGARSMYEKAGFTVIGDAPEGDTLELLLWTPLRL